MFELSSGFPQLSRRLSMRNFVSAAVVACLPLSLPVFAQMMDVPEPVRVPAGSQMAMKAVGVGEITYECRAKAGEPGTFEWAFAGPMAKLVDPNSNKEVGKYYAGPTWESTDGSKITGKQVAVAPSSSGNIPMQLVKTDPAMGNGAMAGVTYIQRVNTKGGVAPTEPCNMSVAGSKKQVPYQADYVFYKG
jgi:hypothetical protein